MAQEEAFIHELLKAEAERIGVEQNTYPEPSLAEGNEFTGVIFSSFFSFSSDPFKVNIREVNLAFGNFPRLWWIQFQSVTS